MARADTASKIMLGIVVTCYFTKSNLSSKVMGARRGNAVVDGGLGLIKMFLSTATGLDTSIGDKIAAAPERISNATADSVIDVTGSETMGSAAGNAVHNVIAFGAIYIWKF